MRLIAKILVGLIDKINATFEPFTMADTTVDKGIDTAEFYEFARTHVNSFLSSGGIFHDQKPDDLGDGLFYNSLYNSWKMWDFPSAETASVAFATLRAYFTEFGCLVRGLCARGAVNGTAHRAFYNDKYMADSDIGPGPLILWCYALAQIKCAGYHQAEITELAAKCYNKLKKDGYWLLNPDGTRSIYGDLRMKFFQAPIQTLAVLILAKLAEHPDYDKIYDKYSWKVEFGDVHVLTWHPWYSELIAFIAYDALLMLEISPYRRKAYLRGLKRLHSVTKKYCNGFYYAIYSRYFGTTQVGLSVINWCLNTFNKTCRSRMATNNSIRPEIAKVSFDKKKHAAYALPISERPSNCFEWNKNPFRLDGSTSKVFTYLDYLVLYAYPKGEKCEHN